MKNLSAREAYVWHLIMDARVKPAHDSAKLHCHPRIDTPAVTHTLNMFLGVPLFWGLRKTL